MCAPCVARISSSSLIWIAAGHGLIPAALAERCRDAYREFRRVQHALRLNGAQYARVPPAQVADHAAAVRELWSTVFSSGTA